MPLTLAQAREEVKTNCAATSDPALTDAEVERCLTDTAYALPWTAATVYAYNTRIAPTTRTGYYYRAGVGGTSGATEPDWPTTNRGIAGDGTITWLEAGADSAELYDLRAATHAAIKLKLAKAAGTHFNFSSDGQSIQGQGIVQNLESLMRRWVPVGVD